LLDDDASKVAADPLLVAQLDQSALYATQLNNALLQQNLAQHLNAPGTALSASAGYTECTPLDQTTAQQLLDSQPMLMQAVAAMRNSPAKHLTGSALSSAYSRSCCDYITSQGAAAQQAAYALLSHANANQATHSYLMLDTSIGSSSTHESAGNNLG
jgi:hypothetical protein